jgi:putative FmdB family regulatory protein
MPTYEYICESCKNAWEESQRISEPALDTCPKCHAKTAKRQISGGNFILKGGGWYADLYSSAKPSKKEGGSSESSGDTKSGDAKSGDAKSAPAPAASTTSTAPATTSTASPSASSGSSAKE